MEKESEPKKQGEEAPKADATAPVATASVETTEVSAIDSAPAKNGNATTSNKRKADATEDAAKPEADNAKDEHTEPPEKKLKTNGATNGTARKPGRPRKDKTSVAPIGKTARKTRSQGAAE
ncbi:hypothetical protein ONZ43_g5656 [Nemania bipapillata]|uniref:Uncharacterized protein n=1 Tax=Nemania bipapillata TaxID=110536 RepID=A0ACC2I808_9PEZI|nr:hypothetical protein ONZ43_g5656 [Nemania bipapillata]